MTLSLNIAIDSSDNFSFVYAIIIVKDWIDNKNNMELRPVKVESWMWWVGSRRWSKGWIFGKCYHQADGAAYQQIWPLTGSIQNIPVVHPLPRMRKAELGASGRGLYRRWHWWMSKLFFLNGGRNRKDWVWRAGYRRLRVELLYREWSKSVW